LETHSHELDDSSANSFSKNTMLNIHIHSLSLSFFSGLIGNDFTNSVSFSEKRSNFAAVLVLKKNGNMLNRRHLRIKVLQALYAAIQSENADVFEGQRDLTKNLEKIYDLAIYQMSVLLEVQDSELNGKIEDKVSNWEVERIAVIYKILLKMGIAEILFFEDIPPKVSINEVIDMAKEYSSANSGKFINGILDAILTDLKKSGKLNKIGRGLIDKKMTAESNEGT